MRDRCSEAEHGLIVAQNRLRVVMVAPGKLSCTADTSGLPLRLH